MLKLALFTSRKRWVRCCLKDTGASGDGICIKIINVHVCMCRKTVYDRQRL